MEFPGNSSHHLGRDRFNGEIGCGNNDREDNICSQTGEEFSNEFLRDFGAQRRAPQVDNSHKNRHLVYEDFHRILGLQRVESNMSEGFTSSNGYLSEANVADSPRMMTATSSDVYLPEILKLLCSFGGRILQRPGDGKLRYIGGETRIISIRKHVGLKELMHKTYALCNHPHTIKYQLPGEDLDALISVCSDEDLLHMIEEYQEAETKAGSQRIRVFLVSSNESSESPKILNMNMNINRNTHQQTDMDHYQYVSALNGVVDVSPQKSSSGQSGTSQTTQFGNASEFSPTFHLRESPTSVHTWENKDCNSPNFMNPYANTNAVHHMPKMQMPPSNSYGQQSPPSSPFSVHKRANTDIPYFFDQNGFFDNSNRPYLVAPNFPQQHRFLFETTTQTQKHPEMNLHDRRPSGDIYPHGQAYSGPEKVTLKKNALSDPQLRDESQINNGLEAFTRQPWKILRKKLHVVATSKWEDNEDMCFKKLEPNTEVPNNWMERDNSPGSFDQASKKHGGSNNTSYFSPNYQPPAQVTSSDSQDSGSSVFSLSVNTNENHLGGSREKSNGLQQDMSLDILVRSNTSDTDQMCDTTKSSDQADYSSTNKNFPVEFLRQEPMIPRCVSIVYLIPSCKASNFFYLV